MAVVMLCYARSGGTFLNKCLGSLPNTVVLSEINPMGGGWGVLGSDSYTTVRDQAFHWYGIDVGTDDFSEGICFLDSYCEKAGKTLVIRDWCFVNFASHDYNGGEPPKRFLTLEALEGKVPIKAFGFIRDSIDIWISRGCPDIKSFYKEYMGYIGALHELDVPLFRYEEFCSDHMRVLQAICDYAGLEYADISDSYRDFVNVNGDTQGKSRGSAQVGIKPLKRKQLSRDKMNEINSSVEMIECNRVTGYRGRY